MKAFGELPEGGGRVYRAVIPFGLKCIFEWVDGHAEGLKSRKIEQVTKAEEVKTQRLELSPTRLSYNA